MSVEAPLNKAIGQRLRALREERQMPRERLALALEMSSENLRNYEAGKQKLTLAMLPTIAETYEMALPALLSELFDLDGEPGHMAAHAGQDLHNASTANYIYSESPRVLSRAESPVRELAVAGR